MTVAASVTGETTDTDRASNARPETNQGTFLHMGLLLRGQRECWTHLFSAHFEERGKATTIYHNTRRTTVVRTVDYERGATASMLRILTLRGIEFVIHDHRFGDAACFLQCFGSADF